MCAHAPTSVDACRTAQARYCCVMSPAALPPGLIAAGRRLRGGLAGAARERCSAPSSSPADPPWRAGANSPSRRGNPASGTFAKLTSRRPAEGPVSGRRVGARRRPGMRDCEHRHRHRRPAPAPQRQRQRGVRGHAKRAIRFSLDGVVSRACCAVELFFSAADAAMQERGGRACPRFALRAASRRGRPRRRSRSCAAVRAVPRSGYDPPAG